MTTGCAQPIGCPIGCGGINGCAPEQLGGMTDTAGATSALQAGLSDIETTTLGRPMTGVSTELTRYMPWIRAHLSKGRDLRSYDVADFPFPVATLEWVHASGLFRPGERERLDAYGIPLLTGVWFDHGDAGVMEMNLRLMTWQSALDDKIIELDRDDSLYRQACPQAFRTGRLPDGADLYHWAARGIHEHVIARGAGAVLPELADSIADWLEATRVEQRWRLSGVVPSVGAYLDNRQVSVGAYPSHTMLRLKEGVLDPGEPVPPPVARLRWLACRIVGLENDIYSAHKEARDGTGLTLLEVVRYHYGLDGPGAVAAALAIGSELRTQHDALVASVLADHTLPLEARRYARLLARVVDGQIEWAFAAARYGMTDFSPADGERLPLPR